MITYTRFKSATRYKPCTANRNASTASINTQYSQFSSFTRATSQVVKRLAQVVAESRYGHAAWVSSCSQRAVRTLARTMSAHASACNRSGNVPTARSASARAREALLHAHAARAGLAPALIASDPGGAFLITEFVPGRVWDASDMGEAPALARLGERLRTLHALPAPKATGFDPATLLQRHAARIAAADPAEGGALAPWLTRAGAILEACRASARSACLVHNDLHHANVLSAGSALYLIDWEYAAVTDPRFDLACLLAYYPQAVRHASLLLEASGLAAPGAARELTGLTWVYVLLSYLWYRALRLLEPAAAPGDDTDSERALLSRLRGG